MLHKLHSCILVCISTCVFLTHCACFIGVHSGLAYTRVICSKPNTYVRTYYREHTFYRFRAGNVNNYTLSNKFRVSYGDIQMTTCILTLTFTWSTLRIWREDFSLNSIATVVYLSKGNSYKLLVLMTSLFVWCMYDVPRVFVDKTCVCDELNHVVHHVWLTVN